jgi:hypothetical protein
VSIHDVGKKVRKFRRHIAWGVALVVGTALVLLCSFYVLAPALLSAGPGAGLASARGAVRGEGERALEWDARLNELNVTHTAAADCSSGCWRLVSARYESPEESGGLHHIWLQAQDEQGHQLAGQPWTVAWPEGSAVLQTKAPGEWADFPMYASYDPFERDEVGPYRAFVGTDEARSDRVQGMGLPLKHHVNFRLVFRWSARPAPTPSPTATRGPEAPPNHCLFIPVISTE